MNRSPFSAESLAIKTRLSPEQVFETLRPLVEPEPTLFGMLRFLLSSKPFVGEILDSRIRIRKRRDRRVAFHPTLVAEIIPREDGSVLECKIGLDRTGWIAVAFISLIWLFLFAMTVRSLEGLPDVDEAWRKAGVAFLSSVLFALFLVFGRFYFSRERAWLIRCLIADLSGAVAEPVPEARPSA